MYCLIFYFAFFWVKVDFTKVEFQVNVVPRSVLFLLLSVLHTPQYGH